MFGTSSLKLKRIIGNSAKESLEHFYLYNLRHNDITVNLYISKKRATRATHIHCAESGDIVWEQFYPFGGMSRPAREKKYALKPLCDKNAITVVIIRGTPGNITGLDNVIFKSHLSAPEKNNIFLMTELSAPRFLNTI